MFQSAVQEAPSTKNYVIDVVGKGHQSEYQSCASNTFDSTGLATCHTVDNFELFHHCSYACELNTEPDVEYRTQEHDNACHKDWFELGTEKNVNASCYIPVDN
jgi:hypothetical protein